MESAMLRRTLVSCGLALMLAAPVSIGLAMEEGAEPVAQQQKDKKPREQAKPKQIRIIQPYSKLTTLTDEQRQQIADIHAKTLEQIKKLQEQEREQILQVLTEDQKAELQRIVEESEAARKAKSKKSVEPAEE